MSGWKRAVPAILVLLIASMPIVYYQVGNLVYTQAAATNLECSGHSARNSPDEFSVELWNEDIAEGLFEKNETLAGDLEHLWFDSWDNATIDVPDEEITLAAWVMESNESRPWVILTHGIRSCKANHEVLIPAAWLHQADFNVVLFDMRDHGNSSIEDGLVSAGQREWRDIVAVWSWLQDEKDVDASNIGIYGVSLGAGAAAIAFEQVEEIEAVFLESAYSSMDKILKEELEFAGFPAFLKDAAVFAGKSPAVTIWSNMSPFLQQKTLETAPCLSPNPRKTIASRFITVSPYVRKPKRMLGQKGMLNAGLPPPPSLIKTGKAKVSSPT